VGLPNKISIFSESLLGKEKIIGKGMSRKKQKERTPTYDKPSDSTDSASFS
jgi:hypothetical protein